MALGVPDPQKLYDMVVAIYDFIMAIPSGIWDKITSIYQNVLWVVAQLEKIPKGIFDLMTKAVRFFKDVPGHLLTYVSDLITWGSSQVSGIVAWISGTVSWFINAIPQPYMVFAPIILVLVFGGLYLLIRFAFWVYHQIPVVG